MNDGHHRTLTHFQITEFASIAQSISADLRVNCPVCLAETASIPQFPAHLANHQERIALFALPRLTDDGDSSLASFKAVPQSISDRGSFSSASSNASWLKPTRNDPPADRQQEYSKGEIVSWLLDLCAVKPQEQTSSSLDPAILQSFWDRSEITTRVNSSSPQRLIFCGSDLGRLVRISQLQ